MQRNIPLSTGAVLAVILVAVGFLIADDPQEFTRKPIDPPFEIVEFPDMEVPGDLDCAAATGQSYAYLAYSAVRAALEAGTAPAEISYLDCFLPVNALQGDAGAVLQRFTARVFDADVLYGFLEREFEEILRVVVKAGNARHSKLAWGTANLGETALIAFEATGQRRFLDLFRNYFDRVMLLTDRALGYYDVYHERVMDAWGSSNLGRASGDPSKWVAHVTHFSVIMNPATGFARAVKANPSLSEYSDWAQEIVTFFDGAYRQFDVDLRPAEGSDERWYWRPLVDKFEATNHLHYLGRALLNMYAMTGDPFFAERIDWIIRVFENGVTLHEDGMASWTYGPYFQVESAFNDRTSRQFSEYAWKGEKTVPFLYEAVRDGFDIEPAVLNAVTKTIRDHIVDGGSYKRNVHPKGSGPIRVKDLERKPGLAYSISGYLVAATEDPRIETQIVEMVAGQPDFFKGGWFAHRRMARAYAALLNE